MCTLVEPSKNYDISFGLLTSMLHETLNELMLADENSISIF